MFVNLGVTGVKLQNTRTEHNLKYKHTNVVQWVTNIILKGEDKDNDKSGLTAR